MGGRKLTARKSIEALSEVIALIRELWKADEPFSVSSNGTHYRIEAVPRGPVPAHDIEIWVGAYKPRILRLTGRLADGWLPSLGYLPEGPAETWARQIVELNRDYGTSSFILASDDPQTIALFGTVIAPMAQELIAAQPAPV